MKNLNLFKPWKFKASILKKSRKNHVFPKTFQTDISNYRVASLLIRRMHGPPAKFCEKYIAAGKKQIGKSYAEYPNPFIYFVNYLIHFLLFVDNCVNWEL